jgi:hypothetical protein
VIVELVVDQAVDVEVVNTVVVDVGDVVGDIVVVAHTVMETPADTVYVELYAWLTQSTVVVLVSPPPAIQAGWKSLPSLFDWASVKTIVSEECIHIPYGWLPGVGVGYS